MQSVGRASSRDPAPSRLSYRVERMWMSPFYRRLLRLGVPLVVMAGAGAWYLSDPARVEDITERYAEARHAIEQRPEFMVQLLSIEGASPELSEAVRDALALRLPISSFDMDLEEMRRKVVAFNAVADARLRVRTGNVLAVEITERSPTILWRHAGGLSLLDGEGHMVAGTPSRAEWPDLPLVAGTAADESIPEALQIIAAAAPLKDRLRGLVRMGERRWDVVLDRRQRILLPEQEPVAALKGLLEMSKGRKLLERDVTVVDVRNPRRPTLRLNRNAVLELRHTRETSLGDMLQ